MAAKCVGGNWRHERAGVSALAKRSAAAKRRNGENIIVKESNQASSREKRKRGERQMAKIIIGENGGVCGECQAAKYENGMA